MEQPHAARAWLALTVTLLVALAACSLAPSPTTTAAPSGPGPSDSPGETPHPDGLALAELRYRLLDRFGLLWYCDPDEYPVARGDEQELAEQRLPEIQADAETYAAIASQLGIEPAAHLDPAQTLAVYRAWKMLNALVLEPTDGAFRFDAIFAPALDPPSPDIPEGTRVAGLVAADGSIDVRLQTPSGPPACPICLAQGTRIATPGGEVPVEELLPGSPVLSLNGEGNVVATSVARIGSAEAPARHVVVRVILDDGRVLSASPGHPLGDGRSIGSLRRGDAVDGSTVRSVVGIPYASPRTYDLLPAGETGLYWANGILLGSTLRP